MSAASTQRYYHQPVLVRQALEALAVRPGGWYIDATLGEAGHASLILDASVPEGRLLGIDADPEALEAARRRLEAMRPGVALLVQGNFSHIGEIAQEHGFAPVDGILMDLGLSSLQLEGEERGFSFQKDQPLDMRFDDTSGETAAELVNTLPEEALADLIWRYGEERRSRAIARAIVRRRPLRTTGDLNQAIWEAVGHARGRIHPSTRTYQALRIVVNQELENLQRGLEQALQVLRPGGRLVVISYHSLEDRVVKEYLRQESSGEPPRLRLVQKRVIRPTRDEVERNRRSRSARLRVAERL